MKTENLVSRLNRRIIIEAPVETADGAGGFTTSWQVFANIWAEIKPAALTSARGKEIFLSGKIQSEKNYIITIRYIKNLTSKMRIVFDGRYLNIRAVINPDEGSKLLEIYAEEGVAI